MNISNMQDATNFSNLSLEYLCHVETKPELLSIINDDSGFNKLLVFYNCPSVIDIYREILPNFFPNDILIFQNKSSSSDFGLLMKSEYSGILVIDEVDEHFNAMLSPILRRFKGPKIAFNVEFLCLNERYIGHFDHVFTRNHSDVRAIQKILGSHRSHYIPEIALAISEKSLQTIFLSQPEKFPSKAESSQLQDKLSEYAHIESHTNSIQENSTDSKLVNSSNPPERIISARLKKCGVFLVSDIIIYPNIISDISRLIAKISLTYDVVIYCPNCSDIGNKIKQQATARIQECMSVAKNTKLFLNNDNIMVVARGDQNAILELDFAICTSYYSHIYCTVARIPFMSISNNRTTKAYMNQCGLSQYIYIIEDSISALESLHLITENISVRSEILPSTLECPVRSEILPNSNYERVRRICGKAIHDKRLILSNLEKVVKNSLNLLSSTQPARLLDNSRTDIRLGVAKFIRKTGDYYNGARLLSGYVLGYPDSMYTQIISKEFKDAAEDTLLDIIHNNVRYLTHEGAILKNKLFHVSFDDLTQEGSKKENYSVRSEFLPIFVDLGEYLSCQHDCGKKCRIPIESWDTVCESLYKLNSKNQCGNFNGIICDMHVNRTFSCLRSYMLHKGLIPYTGPWCGFIHDIPNKIFDIPEFKQSLHMCVGLFTLSESLSEHIRQKVGSNINVITFSCPVSDPIQSFCYRGFIQNETKRLVTLSTENPIAISNLSTSFKKTILVKNPQDLPPDNFTVSHMSAHENNQTPLESQTLPQYILMLIEWMGIRKYSYNDDVLYIEKSHRVSEINRKISDITSMMEYTSLEYYNDIMSRNIVFLDLVNGAPINTIIECIVRRTPVLVNKIPVTIALLGEKYPLYYESYFQIDMFLTDEKIYDAHQYLKNIDSSKFQITSFINHMAENIAILTSQHVKKSELPPVTDV
jgi:hypothetical protein